MATYKPEEYFSDLHVLHAIMAICENSILRTPAGRRAAQSITRQCKQAAGRALESYDRTRA